MKEGLRVGFNARLLNTSTLRGWNRYTINLLSALAKREVELYLYTDSEVHSDYLVRLSGGRYHVRTSGAMKYPIWEGVWLPFQCKKDNLSVFHSPFHYGVPWVSHCPRVMTLHDALQPVNNFKSSFYHWMARTRTQHFITVSEFSKRSLIEKLKIPSHKITVIYEAADDRFISLASDIDQKKTLQSYNIQKPFIFYVGGWEERKNIEFLVRAFALAKLKDVDLVLAGGKEEEKVKLLEKVKSLGIQSQVHLLNTLSDRELSAFYSAALCFVYPSMYEGFGLQLCEAMAMGCPVFASNRASLPEVLGSGGEVFSVGSPTGLVDLLRRVSSDTLFRTNLRERARQRYRSFSWEKAAGETVGVYKFQTGLP